MAERVAIYPGSFDPPTHGHINLIRRGLEVVDRLVVAVVRNPGKESLFSLKERVDIIRESIGKEPRMEVDSFDGLLVDYCRARKASVVLRGLRAVSDFEYEFELAQMNRKLSPKLEFLFMMTAEEYFYVSSRLVREVAALGGDVSAFVPKTVEKHLRAKFKMMGKGKKK